MTYTDRVAELAAKHTRERQELDRQFAILTALPASVVNLDWFIHAGKLWDTSATAHLRRCEYESLRKGPDPTLANVLTVYQAFPVVPVSVYRDSCVSIRTDDDADAEEDKAIARGSEPQVTPIAPFWITLAGGQNHGRTSLHWIAECAEMRVRFEVDLPFEIARKVGTMSVSYEYEGRGDYRRVVAIRDRQFVASKLADVINDARLETINYSSGDRKTLGQTLLYYNACDGQHPQTCTLEALIERLQA